MKDFSIAWKSSNQPRKQRKYIYNAPVHVRGKFLGAHLSKSLRKELGRRSARIVKGDKVKVLRGGFAGVSGTVLRVDGEDGKVYMKEASRKKVAGQEVQVPLEPSNLMIIELETKDQKRLKAKKREEEKAEKQAEKKAAKAETEKK